MLSCPDPVSLCPIARSTQDSHPSSMPLFLPVLYRDRPSQMHCQRLLRRRGPTSACPSSVTPLPCPLNPFIYPIVVPARQRWIVRWISLQDCITCSIGGATRTEHTTPHELWAKVTGTKGSYNPWISCSWNHQRHTIHCCPFRTFR